MYSLFLLQTRVFKPVRTKNIDKEHWPDLALLVEVALSVIPGRILVPPDYRDDVHTRDAGVDYADDDESALQLDPLQVIV